MARKRVFVEFAVDNEVFPPSSTKRILGGPTVLAPLGSRMLTKEALGPIGGMTGATALPEFADSTLALSSADFKKSRNVVATQLDEEVLESLQASAVVKAVWEDPRLEPLHLEVAATEAFDPTVAIGSMHDVIAALQCNAFWQDGIKGDKVAIAICDTGVDKGLFPVIDGWAPEGTPTWGEQADSAVGWHGSMVAHSALLAAPQAKILDVGVLKYSNLDRGAWLSDALKGLNWITEWKARNPEYRVVINNSWSTYCRTPSDANVNVRTYADSRDHPFNERLEVIAEQGTPILFAAGNCGEPCPDLRCGKNDKGPDKSIWGAASLDAVISVAAVDVHGKRLPYSSQGRGAIDREKPDFACYSQFKGFMPAVDPGTSTASPVLAGLVALLLSAMPDLDTRSVYSFLKSSCGDNPKWTSDRGYGIPSTIDLRQIVKELA